ncbi:hypothetical protein COHA_005796 [Chlorella ohadii]|uniref:Uncharacterized protein n=1 Tax=Chlorella ohadii TaxID=2649997 RepID=A0AAD5DM33_9CHLO|nr:hypothetical protein COHA_005796 [Chlorella ohadii]
MSSKIKGSKAAASRPAAAGEAGQYEPDALFQPISLAQPKLDCSGVGLDGEQELWLLQLPLDFPVGAKVSWEVSEDAADGFRGRCTVDGVDYLLLPDQEALSADLFATPSSPSGSVAPVARRLTVVRTTDAPAVCFAQTAEELAAAAVAPRPAALAAPADKKALKRKKADSAKAVSAPVAPVAAPRGGAAPAAPSGTQQAGVVGPGGTPAAAEQQQQGQQGQQPSEKKKKKEKSEKKRKKEEAAAGEGAAAAAAAAAEGGSEKKKKKEKSAKKEKKEKKKDK